jgi:tripartite-type tricarboxylate transporter receptor subunit TctC
MLNNVAVVNAAALQLYLCLPARREIKAKLGTDPMSHRRLNCATFAIMISTLINVQNCDAQSWPIRPVKVISLYTAGNAGDTVARIVLDRVSRQVGQAFIIEPHPGAGGMVAAEYVVKSEPDGYTVLLSSASLSSQVVFHKHMPYEEERDLAEVSLLGIQPNVLIASPASGFHTVADLVAAAKAKPGALTFASAGVGSASHLAGERFRVATGIDVQHVPFRGAEGLAEVLAGRVDFYFVPVSVGVPLLADHKIVALAVSTPNRAVLLPDVPTIAEAGYPAAEYLFWGGLAVPAKTPRAIIDALHDAIQKALGDPSVREKLAKLGVEPRPMSVEEFGKFVHDDVAATVKLANDAHIEPAD